MANEKVFYLCPACKTFSIEGRWKISRPAGINKKCGVCDATLYISRDIREKITFFLPLSRYGSFEGERITEGR